jgi:hypothetical protein
VSSSPVTISSSPAALSSSPVETPSEQDPSPNMQLAPNCTTDEEGYFEFTAGSEGLVTYVYKIEYNNDGNLSALIEPVEKAVGDTVLPVPFPEVCGIPQVEIRL